MGAQSLDGLNEFFNAGMQKEKEKEVLEKLPVTKAQSISLPFAAGTRHSPLLLTSHSSVSMQRACIHGANGATLSNLVKRLGLSLHEIANGPISWLLPELLNCFFRILGSDRRGVTSLRSKDRKSSKVSGRYSGSLERASVYSLCIGTSPFPSPFHD